MAHGKVNAKQIEGVVPLENGGTNNATFSASQILVINSSTSSIISSGYKFNDSGTSSTDIWSADHIISYSATPSVNYIDFGTTSVTPQNGRLWYNYEDNSLSFNPETLLNDVTLNIGQESFIRVFNTTGATVYNGQSVHIYGSGVDVDGDYHPNIILSNASSINDNFQCCGVATHDIPNSFHGFVSKYGLVHDLDLSAFSIGDEIFVSDTIPGGFILENNLQLTSRISKVGSIIYNGATAGILLVNTVNENKFTSIPIKLNNILTGDNSSTGAYEFIGASMSSTTTFNVGEVKGWIVNNSTPGFMINPTVTHVHYAGGTGISLPNLATADATYLLISTASALIQQITFPTPQERRENIYIAKVIHPSRVSILTVNNTVDYVQSPMSALRDMFTPIKLINENIVAYPNGANLNFNTTAGNLYGTGINFTVNELDPNRVSIAAKIAASFSYRTQTGGTSSSVTLIDPTRYDVGGVITTVPGGGANSTNQRIYLFPTGIINIQYGQQFYTSLSNAIAGVQSEIFIKSSNIITTGILIGIISVRKDAANLSDITKAIFTPSSMFGELSGGTLGISTTTLQQAYNNSITPEIVTDTTLGGLSIKNGTGNPDSTTNLLEGINATGSTTAYIRADGEISGSCMTASKYFGTTYSIRNNGNNNNLTTQALTASYTQTFQSRSGVVAHLDQLTGGATGATGNQGVIGATGATGPQGIQGATGSVFLNGLTSSTQYFTASNDTNVTLDIISSGSTHSYNIGWNGLLPLSRGGLGNTTFTQSQILITSTNSVVSSGYIFNDNATSSTDIWSAEKINNLINYQSDIIVSAGRSANTTDSYLRGADGQFMNTSPYILPYNATLTEISASTNGDFTWTAEIHESSVIVSGATLSILGTSSAYGTYSINFNAGDKVMLYCSGSTVSQPRVDIIFRKR